MTTVEELRDAKLKNLEGLKSLGVDPFPYTFAKTHSSSDLHEKYDSKLTPQEHTQDKVSVAGRIMAKRGFGALSFIDLLDGNGKIQVCIKKGHSSEASLKILDFLDRGDFLGASGEVFKTKMGEVTVLVSDLTFLSKSLLPLPEKWHGLQDVELRHRQRHLDLVMNPDSRRAFVVKSKMISLIRKYMDEHGFLEVETPTLQPVYGGANARPFITKSHAWKSDFYLSISPELYLKRLIVGGFERVYTICKNFRNEDVDKTHNPEFTMMEFYASYWDYNDIMNFTEDLMNFVAKELFGGTKFIYQEKEIDLSKPWKRITMIGALKDLAKIDVEKLSDVQLKKLLKEHEAEIPEEEFSRGMAIAELFSKTCEEHLIQPTFVMDHPKETTPLCKPHRKNPELIERIEPYINGWEVGNGYSELNDPILQKKFFEDQANQGRAKGENHPIDMDFVSTLEIGMPPTGGMGLGIDRFAILFTNSPTIRDVILFPQMKPEHGHEKAQVEENSVQEKKQEIKDKQKSVEKKK
ncbi:MAG: lysine--tRNA ligase [Candidatus Diapherotrites archaeon]|nr:lysine--tRNA ligase [Candidatus Diapherotrites archaeon]